MLETVDGKAVFRQDVWKHPEGGGRTHVIDGGNVFEKGGVSTSIVHAKLPEIMLDREDVSGGHFMACGISVVIHPVNPFVPTIHANFRYFELYDKKEKLKDCWFGGGADLTPYYLEECDGRYFHRTLKKACDPFGMELYPLFKRKCDEYFVNKHRNNEARGIGGIFYDYLRPDAETNIEDIFAFSQSNGNAFLKAYIPLVIKNKDTPYTAAHKDWQAYRRGRYVEFNLIHDRGTLFGLQTHSRMESVLISLPPIAKWKYDFHPVPGSPEAQLEEWLKPRDWVNE
ncbi:coproporphyrinogen III oxidase [Chryseobacterium bernardetii]|uniref:Coproporphyrinogen III oxidase n=1 Tax=Chryseobacterium bernardetii TaxID=1241978 RepID=A0ACC6IUL4_9FLAO|nr:coproporphyrinogen III oxidase [Chryseobacterium vietnamense]MDR6441393.1 coproporphyrinogen III oxidase [Chryseobacterium bernardetii]MDR6461544.1 coproporphyrinogen III oxidase [Chryseobacterium sediminis]